MRIEEVNKLPLGAYIIHWRKKHGGGRSLAALGNTIPGKRWLAPCNWVSFKSPTPKHIWKKIKKCNWSCQQKTLKTYERRTNK